MNEWELRVSQERFHRMHVVRLTIEGRETCGERGKAFGDLCTSDEALAAQDERARRSRACCTAIEVKQRVEKNGLREDREST